MDTHIDTRETPPAEAPTRGRRGRLLRRPRSPRRRILKSIAALPALFTVLNGLAGFAAIHFATRDALGQTSTGNLVIASWLVFAAMLCDMLDGRLARLTRRTSDFGGQLDSLCDVISFGVAPPLLMQRTVVSVLRGHVERVEFLPNYLAGATTIERVVWCVAAVYVACAVLRLARFNVENEPDESAHMDFRGLPSPGAAATVVGLVLLFANLEQAIRGWKSSAWAMLTVSTALPVMTLLTGLLMVSRFRYPHVVNQYIRGKRTISYLVKLVVVLLVGVVLGLYVMIAAFTIAYMLSGPLGWLRTWLRELRRRPGEPAPAP